MGRSELRRRLSLESLECRRLLAHSIGHHPGLGGGNPNLGPPTEASIALVGDVLTIVGSKKSDRISVDSDGATLTVKLNKQAETFNVADVASISIDGGNGNDSITIGSSVTASATILGGAGNDRIVGGSGDDVIDGGTGNDALSGGAGDDLITAGPGNDRAFGDAGDDEIWTGSGNDQASGGQGDDVLYGEGGHDKLRGDAGDDLLFGGANKDLLWGGAGDDYLDGGDDKDQLWGEAGNDILSGGAGDDHLRGGSGQNLLDGGAGKDKLVDGTEVDLSQVLQAPLTSLSVAAATGTATYGFTTAEGAAEFELNVTVSGYTASALLDVSVDGVVIGQIATDASGNGAFTASTNPTDPSEAQVPGTLQIQVGSIVLISTDLTGTLALV